MKKPITHKAITGGLIALLIFYKFYSNAKVYNSTDLDKQLSRYFAGFPFFPNHRTENLKCPLHKVKCFAQKVCSKALNNCL